LGADSEGRGNLLIDRALTLPRLSSVIVSLEHAAASAAQPTTIVLGPRPQEPPSNQQSQ
jgi:hypothetical protein